MYFFLFLMVVNVFKLLLYICLLSFMLFMMGIFYSGVWLFGRGIVISLDNLYMKFNLSYFLIIYDGVYYDYYGFLVDRFFLLCRFGVYFRLKSIEFVIFMFVFGR